MRWDFRVRRRWSDWTRNSDKYLTSKKSERRAELVGILGVGRGVT